MSHSLKNKDWKDDIINKTPEEAELEKELFLEKLKSDIVEFVRESKKSRAKILNVIEAPDHIVNRALNQLIEEEVLVGVSR